MIYACYISTLRREYVLHIHLNAFILLCYKLKEFTVIYVLVLAIHINIALLFPADVTFQFVELSLKSFL